MRAGEREREREMEMDIARAPGGGLPSGGSCMGERERETESREGVKRERREKREKREKRERERDERDERDEREREMDGLGFRVACFIARMQQNSPTCRLRCVSSWGYQ